jgi:hypothetical protein
MGLGLGLVAMSTSVGSRSFKGDAALKHMYVRKST